MLYVMSDSVVRNHNYAKPDEVLTPSTWGLFNYTILVLRKVTENSFVKLKAV